MSRPEPTVGMPATIVLYTDTQAAVVVKVNPKSVVLARVETGERRRTNHEAEPFPVIVEDGDVSKPIAGTEQRYMRRETSDGPRYANGSIGIVLGKSYSRTDYRH